MTVTREEGLRSVEYAMAEYYEAQLLQDEKHEALKRSINVAKNEGNATQQEIADRTIILAADGNTVLARLSRQRISQINHEDD